MTMRLLATTLLPLSTLPGRPPDSSIATPFHSLVDSIVGQSNEVARASSPAGSDERDCITDQYSLGLRNKHAVATTGNAPNLLFGSQVSPLLKCQRFERKSLDPSRRLTFAATPAILETASDTKAKSIATGTANFVNFNNNDRITSKNADRVVVALRKLPIPVFPNSKRSIANSLICVTPASLPLKQDITKQSCANLMKRIRNPLGVRSASVPRNDTLNARQRSKRSAASNSNWTVPDQLNVVTSFSLRALLIEDLWRLQPGTAINVFLRISGGPTCNPCFDEQWLKAHVTTEQRLPNLKGPGKGVLFRQVQGYVLSNPHQHDILGRPVSDLSEIVTNTFQRDGIVVCCPAGPTGKDFDLLLTFHELFFFPMCVFVQADLPFSSQWQSALQIQGADMQKLLLLGTEVGTKLRI
jgi:hypothetical protein